MSRTQYIFIDYENVHEPDLSRISGKPVQVFVIIGVHQTKVPTSLLLIAQDHREQVKFIQTPVAGRNALDLILTLELGRSLASDPSGYFHIVSKDTDFDSVIRHLQSQTKLIARHTSLTEIPALRTPEERVARLKDELSNANHSRPCSRQGIENKIRSCFENKATPEFIEKTIHSFIQAGLLDFTDNDKVLYKVA
jgi:hypothetical protein